MPSRFLSTMDRFNAAHPWSHNDAYLYVVLREARKVRRRGGTRALDVGCGTGHLVMRLADVFDEVVGLEPDATTASFAAEAASACNGVHILSGRFPLSGPTQFDFISMVAVLHHMSLDDSLSQVRQLLAPNGRLAIIGAYRETSLD